MISDREQIRAQEERLGVRHLEGQLTWDAGSMRSAVIPVEPREVIRGGALAAADWENLASVFEAGAGRAALYGMDQASGRIADEMRAQAARCLVIAGELAVPGGAA
jgi:hypothetical protein